jgi:hypothetical protein
MSFFNSKEEVMSVELTPYGRQKYFNGLFNPYYYAFYDDDIIYDSEKIGFTETQNNTQTRILTETPYLKPIPRFTSASTNMLQEQLDYSRYLGVPLVSSEDVGQEVASFNISFKNVQLESVVLTSSYEYDKFSSDKITQINLKESYVDITIDSEFSNKEILQNEILIFEPNLDNTYIKMKADSIFINIFEENTDFFNKNFDIEIYKIENDKGELLSFEDTNNPRLLKVVDDMLGGAGSTYDIDISDPDAEAEDWSEEKIKLVSSYFDVQFDIEQESLEEPDRIYIYGSSKIVPSGDDC